MNWWEGDISVILLSISNIIADEYDYARYSPAQSMIFVAEGIIITCKELFDRN